MLYSDRVTYSQYLFLIFSQDFTQVQLMQFSIQPKIPSVALKRLDTANFFKERMKMELLFYYLINQKRMCGNVINNLLIIATFFFHYLNCVFVFLLAGISHS